MVFDPIVGEPVEHQFTCTQYHLLSGRKSNDPYGCAMTQGEL